MLGILSEVVFSFIAFFAGFGFGFHFQEKTKDVFFFLLP